MPSDPPLDRGTEGGWQRLHPLTLGFAVGARLYHSRALILPAVVALVVSRRRASSNAWEDLQGWLLVPALLLLVFELIQYFTFAYRFDRHEIAITRGLFWKRERHIPYDKVQNIELVQRAAHRLAGVAVVRLDTGTGAGAEGELSVLSLDAVAALRDAVRVGRRGPDALVDRAAAPDVDAPVVLVSLDLRELLLHGLLTSRGWVVIAAGMGALWQADLDWWGVRRFLPSTDGLWGGLRRATPTVALEAAVLILLALLVLRLLSAAWSAIKHFEFTLTARGTELFQSYGLLTRVGRTIPRARIQKLTVSEEPLMRLLGRATITIDTAASVAERHTQQPAEGSHVLVPILPAARVAALVRAVHPSGGQPPDLGALDWQRADPRAFRRLLRVRLVLATLIGAASYGAAPRWAIPIGLAAATALLAQAWVTARFTAFAWSGDTLCVRRAAWARHVTLVRAGRAQVVAMDRSPFDRRWGMAAVRVDTAGAIKGGHRVHIRWLSSDVADALYARLRHAAAP